MVGSDEVAMNRNAILYLGLFILLAGGLIMVPTVMTGRLIGERLKNIGELKRREIELQRRESSE